MLKMKRGRLIGDQERAVATHLIIHSIYIIRITVMYEV